MKKKVKNIAASMRAKLLDLSRTGKKEFQFVLDRWAAERFLLRLGVSAHRERFVLKGATLFLIWRGDLPRRTRDVDLLGYGSPDINDVIESMKLVCSVESNDGIFFKVEEITAIAIREDAEYDGVRVRIPAVLDKARTVLQVDIGFGDVVSPAVEDREMPVMLPLDAPKLRVYPAETVIAEKLQAMVHLDVANSRMKDFYDVWLLSQEQTFQMHRVAGALKATFARRKTKLPSARPMALTEIFVRDPQKLALWSEFLNRAGLPASLGELSDICESIAVFVMPVIEAVHSGERASLVWPPKGPWQGDKT
jgi:hypothetical protein